VVGVTLVDELCVGVVCVCSTLMRGYGRVGAARVENFDISQ